jgi:hypothetical protein
MIFATTPLAIIGAASTVSVIKAGELRTCLNIAILRRHVRASSHMENKIAPWSLLSRKTQHYVFD